VRRRDGKRRQRVQAVTDTGLTGRVRLTRKTQVIPTGGVHRGKPAGPRYPGPAASLSGTPVSTVPFPFARLKEREDDHPDGIEV